MHLATIGYESSSIDDFLDTLLSEGVTVLVDIRELPISRKRGFAKTKLANALNERGIEYVHLKSLGDPKPGREAARKGDFELFRKIFSAHMKTEPARQALIELQEISKNADACLMCYEKDPKHCHRSIVAARVKRRTKISIKHLEVVSGISKRNDEHRKAA